MGAAFYLLFCLIGFGASVVGAICGIGGGVIIKPLLDAFHVLPVETISFLSGCTVLAMSAYSVLAARRRGRSQVNETVGIPLALGAAVGGLLGKLLFHTVASLFSNADMVGAVQAACLFVITFGTLIYTVKKQSIATRQVKNRAVCLLIGLLLGLMSSFLGIGGGPINLVVLYYFFSMGTKEAAQNSLYIILYSQLASLLQSLVTGSIPSFPLLLLLVMVLGGLLGGKLGRKINEGIADETVSKLFIGLMLVIMGINLYNIYQFV